MKKNWILVTGAAQGLGATICEHLAREGWSVLVHYRTSSPDETVKVCRRLGAEAEAVHGDFSQIQTIDAFVRTVSERYSLEGLINNVGNYDPKLLMSTESGEWEGAFCPNVFAPAILAQAFVTQLATRSGAIINIGSAGIHGGRIIRRAPLYSISKWALWGLTRALAQELAEQGVRVNMVSPGQIEGSQDLQPGGPVTVGDLPMKRAATASEVAEVVTFLLSSAGQYITGQNIDVAGGYAL